MTFTIVIFLVFLFASLAVLWWLFAVNRPNLFVSGGPGGLVAEYTPAGTLVGIFVSPGSGGMTSPENLRFGPNGNLFVCCHEATTGMGVVKEYDGLNGTYVRDFVPPDVRSALDIVFDAAGNAWVAYISTGVKKFSSSGVLLGTYTASLDQPRGLALHPDGDILVSIDDFYPLVPGGNRIIKLDATTGAPSIWASVANPHGITSSPGGRFYVCSQPSSGTTAATGADGIVARDSAGQPVASAPAMLTDSPSYIVFSNGDLFVTRFGHAVQRFNAATGSLVTTFPDEDWFTPPGSELPIHIWSNRGIAVRPTAPVGVRALFRRFTRA